MAGITSTAPLDDDVVRDLAGRVSGPVLAPGQPGYDAARAVHNGLIDRSPAVIVRCHSTADVVAALAFAREQGRDVSVRGGGHNVAGRAVADGVVMIDLAEMRDVAVDPDARTATAQGGVRWAELNDATAQHGLAVPGGMVSTTGIAGYTLGGGLGWLMSKYGLASDNLLAAELVTAAGEVLQVDELSHPDLFWALRGGGGNFGVVTTFTYALHPVTTVTGGLVAHSLDAAPDLLRFYRDAIADASDDLTVIGGLIHAPDGSGTQLAALVVFHAGDPDAAERDLKPLLEYGSPLVTQVGPMPYPAMNRMLDAAYPDGAHNYWLSSFVEGLPDELIDAAVERFRTVPSPMSAILFERFHGAVTRIATTATAVPHRAEGWNLVMTSVWPEYAGDAANIRWSRETFEELRPSFSAGRWLNYLGDDQGDDAIRDAYGPNYERLREVKRRYDPENVFHRNHNIAP
jgi:FAD/FMN-containing dehydrogenase